MDKSHSLSKAQLTIIEDKGTEAPYSGQYDHFNQAGTYLCRRCGLALFRSSSKFHSGCGWPSFDTEIPNHVERKIDSDGHRTEILCSRCHAHLGHVFHGEGFTPLNTRHCVNSASLDFISDLTVEDTEEAIVAAGCFWGVEYYFSKLKGVLKTEVGYSGGYVNEPSYEDMCRGSTGHYECIRIVYDPAVLSYRDLLKFFFEIHHFAQENGQGPDIGEQYLSVAFYYDDMQKNIVKELISQLEQLGYQVATKCLPVSIFWPAEEYHQDYYQKTGKAPYCHQYIPIFRDK